MWPKVPIWSSDASSKTISNFDSNSLRYATVLLRSSRDMGDCGRCGFALWTIGALWAIAHAFVVTVSLSLVMRYGPLRGMWFCAMGHIA
jgi:hypothetical protein